MRVLLVEDERKVAAYVQRSLEEQGYAVDVASDGHEVWDWVQVTNYDLMVVDVMLPGMNGFEVCRKLRDRGIAAPVLLLTARDAIHDRITGLDSGADDYLTKPFAMEELHARLRALLRRSGSPEKIVLEVQDLKMDTTSRRVTRGEKEIELTAKEYAILECLLRRANQVLSRDTIAQHVWNFGVYHQSNVVDVYIRNLRRKLDSGRTTKLIETVRGVGYRLRVLES